MTPVDLNRLREALTLDLDDLLAQDWRKVEEMCDASRAVLDAPTVWWCVNTSAQSKCEPDSPIPWPPRHDDCGWHALVPVKGTNDAT